MSKRSRTRSNVEAGQSEEITNHPTAQSITMTRENHPWLNWPGATFNDRIGLNNRLAEIQHKNINQPRVMDWSVANRIGVTEELEQILNTRTRARGVTLNIPIWTRAFSIQEVVYREWCLEFYSSITLDKNIDAQEILSKEVIFFRLGGVERRCTIPEFGLLLGFFTEEEVETLMMGYYLVRAEFDSSHINAHEIWNALSGEETHTKSSKIANCRFPILRLIHKLLTYSVLHRSSQNDKVYLDDLWLLSLFQKRDPKEYALVPWVLACHMEHRGAGTNHPNGQICCGNFITKIGRNLGLLTGTNTELCSLPIQVRRIELRDLEKSNLIDKNTKRLIEAGTPPTARGETSTSGSRRSMQEEMQHMSQQLEQLNIHVNQIGGYVHYHAHNWAQSSGAPWSPYAPPHMYVDPQYGYNPYPQQEQQQEDAEDNE